MEVGIYHIEGRSSYFLPQKGTIIYFQWPKERECIDYSLNFLIDAFLTFLFMICFQKYISKVTNFCLPVKIVSAILNDQVGSHMLNHLIFMFCCRSTRICVPHCKEETWLNRLVWNLVNIFYKKFIFSGDWSTLTLFSWKPTTLQRLPRVFKWRILFIMRA